MVGIADVGPNDPRAIIAEIDSAESAFVILRIIVSSNKRLETQAQRHLFHDAARDISCNLERWLPCP
jgi:hypothetical protein